MQTSGMVQMLVNCGDDDPVSGAFAFLPGLVVKDLRGGDEGIRDDSFKPPNLDTRMRPAYFQRSVGRSVVVDDIAVDETVIMAEKEPDHRFFVPGHCVE